MQSAELQPVSLRELAGTLFIYKWTIVGCTLLFGIGAVLISLFQPETFEASVQIWTQDQSPGLRGSSNFPSDSAARVKMTLTNVREVIFSRQVLETTLAQCGLLAPPDSAESAAEDPLKRDREVASLSKAIRLEAPKGSDFGMTQIFFIRLRHRDPDKARELLAALLDSFRSRYERMNAEQAEHLYHETSAQLEKSREQLSVAEAAFDRCVKSLEGGVMELVSLGGSAGGDSELRRSLVLLNERLVPAEADLLVRQAFLEQLRDARRDTSMLVNVPGPLIREYPSLEQTVRELGAAQVQLDSTAARLTPNNPAYLAAQERVRLAEQTYLVEVDRAIDAIEQEQAAKLQAVEFMRTEKQSYLTRIAELTNQFVTFDGLQKELAQRRAIVADAEKRSSDAAHALVTASQETLFATLDGPRTATKPVSPKRKLNVMAGVFLGIMTGIGLAFLARQLSQTVRSETDLVGIGDDLMIISVPKVRRPLEMAG